MGEFITENQSGLLLPGMAAFKFQFLSDHLLSQEVSWQHIHQLCMFRLCGYDSVLLEWGDSQVFQDISRAYFFLYDELGRRDFVFDVLSYRLGLGCPSPGLLQQNRRSNVLQHRLCFRRSSISHEVRRHCFRNRQLRLPFLHSGCSNGRRTSRTNTFHRILRQFIPGYICVLKTCGIRSSQGYVSRVC